MFLQQVEIIPGILEKEFSRISERVNQVSPYVDWIHIDIADNTLVPNESFTNPSPFKELISETGKKFELHMMVEDPFTIIDSWINVGFQRFLLHWESIARITNYEVLIAEKITQLKAKRIEVGIAIDRDTPVDEILSYLGDVDCVLVMTIKAGFSGQAFIPELLNKVKKIKNVKPSLPVEVDGGINDQTALLSVNAGATRLISTSFIFNSKDIENSIWTLKNLKN